MTRRILILCTLLLPLLTGRSGAQGFFEYDYEIRTPSGEINSEANDYAPVESSMGERLVFTSYRSDGSIGEADIYQMSRPASSPDAPWARLLNPGSPFNSEGNDGSAALIREDGVIVFATDGRADGVGSTDLYIAKIENGRIGSIRSLGATINTKHWESQPAITQDENTLYFISDRPGGEGKEDIWMATKSGEDADGFPLWSEPVNLGPSVNTKGRERSPTVTLDGRTIYFASDGLQGFGGYDIYMATRRQGIWSEPSNLGSIINSDEDDIFFFAPRNDHPFYFASSREGGRGGLDIYSGTPNVFGVGLIRLALSMTDGKGNPVEGVGLVIDTETGDTIARMTTTTARQEYAVQLPANRSYRVVGQSNGVTQEKTIPPTAPGEDATASFRFGEVSLERIDLSDYTIPFFVQGYYRPNTTANLEELFGLRSGVLQPAGYIEDFARESRTHQQYVAWANDVEAMFASVRSSLLGNIIPRFDATAGPDEVLEIQVTGYTDPQAFEGIYHDETASFFRGGREMEVAKGSTITNLELSGLRAFFTARHLDGYLSQGSTEQADLYRRLRNKGRIRFVPMAGDVATDASGTPFETQRRITVVVDVVGK